MGRYLELLLKSNPTMLESLYAPDKCIVVRDPIMKTILDNREKFLSKDALRSFGEYAYSQIKKAKGYNKLCSYPENMERKPPIDFCYTFNDKQGTEPVLNWLERHGLKQIYCGLNHLPNMNQMYGVFYDWGQHLHMEYTKEEWCKVCVDDTPKNNMFWDKMYSSFYHYYGCTDLSYVYDLVKSKGYHGIVKEDGSSCDIHLDSILKGDTPICYLSYNEDGYQSHCRQYKDWSEWKSKRNEIRYKSNFGQGYDAKNMSECIRLLKMSVELAKGEGFNVDRSLMGDAQYLLDVKAHKYSYEQLIEEAESLKKELDCLMPICSLPEHVDEEFVNNLLIDIRRCYFDK